MATSKYEKEFRKKYGITSATTEENNSKKAELPDWAKKAVYTAPKPKRGYAKLPTVRPERNGRIELPKDTENGRYYEVPEKKETFAEKVKKISLPKFKGTPTSTAYGQREQIDTTMPYAPGQTKDVPKKVVSLPKPILHTKTPQGMYTDTSTGVKATPRKATMSGTYGKYEDDSVELGKQMVGTSTLNKDNGMAQTKDVKGTLNLTPGQRAVRDIPRNFASGLTKLASTGIQIVSQKDGSTEKLLTEQEFNAQSGLRKAGRTYDDYKRYTEAKNSQNEPLKNIKSLSDSLASEVNEDTTLGEKIVRGALQSVLPSAGTSAMGGGVASAVGNMTANKAVIEIARNSPLFLSSVDEGLGDADKLGLKGTERATYAVGSGLIQTITERISVPGLEGARLGLTEITKKGLRESLFDLAKSFVNEGGTEGLATFSTQIMQQFGYGVEQDWQKNIEEILVSAGSGAIMGGADVAGSMVTGVGYKTVGVDGDKVIVETTDGRVERVDPRILANYKINESKRAYLTKNQTQEAIPESNPTDTMPIQEPTINQDEFEANKGISTQEELKPIVEPLNEVVEDKATDTNVATKIKNTVPKTEQVMGRVPEQVSELDKLKSWVANVEKNEIQKSSKQNKAKYDRAVAKIKALEKVDDIEIIEKAEERNNDVRKLKVADIGVDPKRFQFKADTSSSTGASNNLKGAERFNPLLADSLTVWQDKEGKNWVVNGHHRLELARRTGTENIEARTMYEADGVTESEARRLGAQQNIAQGTGTSKDAAQFFRETEMEKKDFKTLGLALTDNKIEKAYNISQLSERLWDNYVNGKLRETQANLIGKAFPLEIEGNDTKQASVMDYLNKKKNITDNVLQEVIDEVSFSETVVGEQQFLWGLEETRATNFDQRVDLIARIKDEIRGEKSVLSKLLKSVNASKVESIGNVLNQEGNADRVDVLKNSEEIIDFAKKRQDDPINKIINDYATKIAESKMKLGEATDKAIVEISEIIQKGNYLDLITHQMKIGEVTNEGTKQNITRNVETINQGGEREEQAEGQFNFFGEEESTVTKTEEKLISNNMAFKDDDYISSDDEVSEIRYATSGLELLDGFKESQTKKTTMEGKGSSRIKQAIEDEDAFYKTISIAGEMFRSKKQVEGRVESELVRLETMLAEGTALTPQDGTDVQAVFDAIDDLLTTTGDSYWVERARRINKVRKTVFSGTAQLLATAKAMKKASPRMTLVGLEVDVEEGMTPTEKTNADNVERGAGKLLVDIPEVNGKIQLDQASADAFIKLVMDGFPKLKKAWGRQWTKELVYGATTKAQIMDSIYTALQIPHLGVQTRSDILDNLEKMTKLKEGSPEYNTHNNEVRSIIRRSHGINIWTKISALQTYAMLGNAKTGIKNELGNWMGFSMGQLDSRFSKMIDKSYSKQTGIATVADKGNLGGYVKGYKKGVALSLSDLKNKTDSRENTSKYFDENQGKIFQHEKGGYARILVDLVTGENRVEAAKQFAEHTAAKSENLTKFIVDDRRHGFARYEMALAAIEATDIEIKKQNESLPKDKQIVFSAEELKAKIHEEVAYYTFNNKTEGAKILKSAVQALNKLSTGGATTEFGVGTLIAKYTQTPMNIIAFTGDHLGVKYVSAKGAYKADFKELSKTMPRAEAKIEALTQNQKELATAKGKAITGLSLVLAGAMLSALGGITPDRDEDDESLLLEAQGYKGSYFNLSGLVRNTFGLGGDELVYDYGPGDVRNGDTLTSINQLAPGGAFLLLGSRIFNNLTSEQADKSLMGIVKSVVPNVVQGLLDSSTDLVDMPFNRTATIIINELKYAKTGDEQAEAWTNIGNKMLGSAVTSFFPAIVKQTAQYMDPFAKTYAKDSGEALKQQIMASTPTMRDNVPYAFTINGERIQYSGEKNAIEALWSAYAAPYYKSEVKYDKVTTEITEQVKNKKIAPPRLAPNKLRQNSTDFELTKPDRQKFQKVYWDNYRITKDVDEAYNAAKIDYLKTKKIPYTVNEKGIIKK